MFLLDRFFSHIESFWGEQKSNLITGLYLGINLIYEHISAFVDKAHHFL